MVLARRLIAAVLAGLALVLALVPHTRAVGVTVAVTAAEIPAGATVRAADLAVREWPAELVPAGALHDPQAAVGRVLVGAARAGEPLTDVRLVGAGAVPGRSGVDGVRH